MTLYQVVPTALQSMGIGADIINRLLAESAAERKDDPARQPGLHGPYEEFNLLRTGRLPDSYFAKDDPEPWGLLTQESRRNILWQVLSGVMDKQPDFAAAYMALALDKSLGDEDYMRELTRLHHSWRHYLSHALQHADHHHRAMRGHYHRVNCTACSALTAIAVTDGGMHKVFTEMLPLKPEERRQLLQERGIAVLLDTMIPDLG